MRKGKKLPLFICVTAALFFIFCWSCEKEGSRNTDNSAEESGGESDNISENTRQITEKPKETLTMELEGEGAEAESAGREQQPAQPLPGKEFLLSTISMRPVTGEDLVIGGLQNLFTAGPAALEIHQTIDGFLQALTEARVAEELSHPEWKEQLLRSIWYHIEMGNIPGEFRIGEITDDSERGWADVRLISALGRTAGEIYLSRIDDSWFVTDLQVDLAELSRPYEKEGPFEPNIYRWVHQY